MKALFVELPAFTRFRADYLDDERFRALQNELMEQPEKGDVIDGYRRLAQVAPARPKTRQR